MIEEGELCSSDSDTAKTKPSHVNHQAVKDPRRQRLLRATATTEKQSLPLPKLEPGKLRFLTRAEREAIRAAADLKPAPEAPPPPKRPRVEEEVEPEEDEDEERRQVKHQYLGTRRERKKVQKPSEKFRNIFQFDWDNEDDTTKNDFNPLYCKRHEPQLLFGRGFRAGLDVREQRKSNAFYDSLSRRRKEKLEELLRDGRTIEEAEALLEQLGVVSLTGQAALDLGRSASDNDDDAPEHWSAKPLSEMTDRDWRILREDFSIYVKGGRVPHPIRSWSESGLRKELLDAIAAAGYTQPTPIQMQAMPVALEMRDFIGIAETGSGKTAAFMLPMLQYVAGLPRLNDELSQWGPYGLVLAPSRELAIQIRDETEKFAGTLNIRSIAVVGGRSAETQAFELRRGMEIVIGTPGRIRDCLEKAYTVLIQCNYVVLDEADRMVDLGFEEVVKWILDQIPNTNLKSADLDKIVEEELQAKAGHRQYRITQMFSATMPTSVERLARLYLRQPAVVSIGLPGVGKQSIEQRVEFVTEARKKLRLVEILDHFAGTRVIVFVNQKRQCDVIARLLSQHKFKAVTLHGGKTQEIRESSLEQFKSGDQDILVATDVAGRGLDVEDVGLVINYDMPQTIEPYTHRIGRTGRAGKEGISISFLTEEDQGIFFDLKNLLAATNNLVPQELAQHPAAKQKVTPPSV